MEFDLKTIEALAPDQASLSAASKLTKRSNWPRLEKNEQQALIWGECQGSGSNPYRVVVDTGDHGYKCTCPSRKFPVQAHAGADVDRRHGARPALPCRIDAGMGERLAWPAPQDGAAGAGRPYLARPAKSIGEAVAAG